MNFGFNYADLHDPARLERLDRLFRQRLTAEDPVLAGRFERYRALEPLAPAELSALLVDAARPLSRFVAELFGITEAREALLARTGDESVLFRFRFSVFQKRSAKKYPDAASPAPVDRDAAARRGAALVGVLAGDAGDEELRVARAGRMLFDLSGSLATPRGKDASFSPEAAREKVASLRRVAAGTSMLS